MAYTSSHLKKERTKHIVDKNLKTVADCLKINVETKPDLEAVVFVADDGQRIAVTFRDLYDNAIKAAKRFITLGIRQTEYVAISMRTCPEWLYAFFGAMYARAIPVNLSFTYTDGSDVIAFMEKMKTCSAIVLDPGTDEENWNIFRKLVNKFDKTGKVQSDKMPYLKYLVCQNGPKDDSNVLTFTEMMAWENISIELPVVNPEDTFTLFQTSGSTGIPKAVVHIHRTFVLAASSWVEALSLEPDSVFFNDRPFMWGGGFPATVITGNTRVTRLETSPTPVDHVAWQFDVIKKERCTNMYALPLGFHNMLDRKEEIGDDWPLQVLIATGQPISKHSAECLGVLCKAFGNLYGSVEQWLTCCSIVDSIDNYIEYSIGSPLEGVEIKIVDDHGATVAVKEKGEIYVKNEAMFKEYCNDPVMTNDRITPDGWYKTDDMGYMTENGTFFCTGRKSEIILSGGLSVTPSILEAILSNCSGVARSACVPVSDEVMFQVVCACIVRQSDSSVTEDTLRKYCQDMHTDKPRLFTVLPTYYMFFEKFPETYSGKVNKKELTKIAEHSFGTK